MRVLPIVLLSAVLAGCGGEDDPGANIPLGFLKETYHFKRVGEEQAVYGVHHVSNGEGTTVIVINSRHSPLTGWDFAKREYDCERGKMRNLASGTTYANMSDAHRDMKWVSLVRGSSAFYVAEKACSIVGRGLNV